MDRTPLKAQERNLVGKKVKNLRRDGFLPANVFGHKVSSEAVTIGMKDFLNVYSKAGETGLVDLKIGEEKIRPVLIRDIQYEPVKGGVLHVDFYQVNLKEKVKVWVSIVLKEMDEEIESVKAGEAVVLHTLSEVEVEALPTDLPENIEVDLSPLKNVDDSISVADLSYNRETITVLAEPEETVVKLAPAVTEEMKALMEEQQAETAAAAEAEGEAAAEGAAEQEEGGEEVSSQEGTQADETEEPPKDTE